VCGYTKKQLHPRPEEPTTFGHFSNDHQILF
jgi:hypothetical protein